MVINVDLFTSAIVQRVHQRTSHIDLQKEMLGNRIYTQFYAMTYINSSYCPQVSMLLWISAHLLITMHRSANSIIIIIQQQPAHNLITYSIYKDYTIAHAWLNWLGGKVGCLGQGSTQTLMRVMSHLISHQTPLARLMFDSVQVTYWYCTKCPHQHVTGVSDRVKRLRPTFLMYAYTASIDSTSQTEQVHLHLSVTSLEHVSCHTMHGLCWLATNRQSCITRLSFCPDHAISNLEQECCGQDSQPPTACSL